jgi:hypothetical protein
VDLFSIRGLTPAWLSPSRARSYVGLVGVDNRNQHVEKTFAIVWLQGLEDPRLRDSTLRSQPIADVGSKLGQINQLCPPVARTGVALDQPPLLKLIDDQAIVAAVDPKPGSQIILSKPRLLPKVGKSAELKG